MNPMSVGELIDKLLDLDPKARVYTYDAEWDMALPVTTCDQNDPRADKRFKLGKKTVWIT